MILDDVKADAAKAVELKREWETATVARAWREFAASAKYRAAFKHYYEQRRQAPHPGCSTPVEIYRPLIADPKEARKKRAAEGKAMKKGARETGDGQSS